MGIVLGTLAGLLALAPAGGEPDRVPFPLVATGRRDALGEVLALDRSARAELTGRAAVRMAGVPTPSGRRAEALLERVDVGSSRTSLWIDGRPSGRPTAPGLSAWSGSLAGQPGSAVFLAFSEHGSRGWIAAEGGLLHLIALPGDGGRWARSTSRAVSEARLRPAAEPARTFCATESPPGAPIGRTGAAATADAAAPLPLYEARVAVETDFQFFQLFGDAQATATYAATLFAAVSARYREQVGTILTLAHLGTYTNAHDPWTTQESGGDVSHLLTEFEAKWGGGQAPVPADAHLFLSGALLFGGIANLDALCDPDESFAVCADMHGQTPFPLAVDPLNWDFEIVAHELGHVFGSPHTHDFCPPLDICSYLLGPCQTSQACTSQGTIMSYCYGCPGGLLNITTYFHPAVVQLMRQSVEASCLQPFAGVLPVDVGFALAGSGGTPSLAVSWQAGLLFDVAGAPASQPGLLVHSPTSTYAPLFGGVLVPGLDVLVPVQASAAGEAQQLYPLQGSFPAGVDLASQGWFLDPASSTGFAATNGVEYELIL